MSEHSWKELLRQNFTHWEKLADFIELNQEQRLEILKKANFPLNIPLRLAQKVEKANLQDPILKQFLPIQQELESHAGFVKDPVEDQLFRIESKLLKKYAGRALLVCTSACAMNCRFCFRQNFDYEVEVKGYEKELNIIANDKTISEVILSGGDPLSLSDRVLGSLLSSLNDMSHVKRIRFHTRFPIGIPERIDEGFLKLIKDLQKQVWFVIHSNHPRELDSDVIHRLSGLRKAGTILLCQSVLLKGVNDDVDTLKELFLTLVDNGISPYYLHQLDRVSGVGHFEVPEEKGQQLVKELMTLLPGYAVPKYVREIAGQPNKTLI